MIGDENRQMLSDQQWKWLENELFGFKNQKVAIPELTIIVSSVQVLTTNPTVESWGHFPSQRKRLLRTLSQYEKQTGKSLLLLSVSQSHS